jgi:hypothetical protein
MASGSLRHSPPGLRFAVALAAGIVVGVVVSVSTANVLGRSWAGIPPPSSTGVFPILKTLGYAADSRVSAYFFSYSIGVS